MYTVLYLFSAPMMLICSPANFLNKFSLEHSLSIKNDFGRAANQHHLKNPMKTKPHDLIIKFGSVQTLLLKNFLKLLRKS